MSEKVKIATLLPVDLPLNGVEAKIAGWGFTASNDLASTLQKLNITIMEPSDIPNRTAGFFYHHNRNVTSTSGQVRFFAHSNEPVKYSCTVKPK